jgi:putative toxin-antitoxin system antitoxin component (TIGR02293 family)
MPVGSADALKGRLGVGDDVLAELLGISQKTLSRARAANSLLDAVASDRLFRVGRIAALAIGVLEDEHRALHWLRRAQVGLGGRTPVSMLGTDIGCTEVERLLLRVEHGVYA